jgi:hypothetical protein
MKIALLGYSQSGKKTLFELLTGRLVPESRKPGDEVEGISSIRDARVAELSRLCNPKETVYAENQYVLCPDVTDSGTDRAWLDAARQCDLLCLVVRAFASEDVYHPRGSVDASRDLENLRAELIFADLELADRRLRRMEKEKRTGKSPGRPGEEEVLRRGMAALEEGTPLSALTVEQHEYEAVKSLDLLTFIPSLAVHNVSEEDVAADAGGRSVGVSCLLEREIMAIDDPAERTEYLSTYGLAESGLDRVNAAAYEALGLMSFYTVGPDEVRAWTIRQGTVAPVSGGKVHTDIERGFIRVEIMKYNDFVQYGSEKAVKDAGKIEARGRDYVIEDGDICHFLFNV